MLKKMMVGALLLSSMAGAQVAFAQDLTFTLINKTKGTVTYFHASPTNVDQWEDDILGDKVLKPGQSIKITIADGRRNCKYDMRFEFDEADGLEDLEDTQNLCEMGSYTLHQ